MNLVKKLRRRFASPTATREYRFVAQGFDRAFYLSRYPDVRADGIDPVLHYIRYGCRENRDPTPLFSTGGYLARNPDVAQSGVNPFFHYMEFGRYENRDARPLDAAPIHEPVDWKSEGVSPETNAAIGPDRPVLAEVFPILQHVDIDAAWPVDPAKTALHSASPRMIGIVDRLVSLPNKQQDEDDRAEALIDALVARAKGKDVSFDLWGTLLRPRITMDCISLRSARATWLTAGQVNPAVAGLHPIDLLNLRSVAEAEISDEYGQYRIEDLASQLAQWLELPSGCSTAFAEREARITADAVLPDPVMAKILSWHVGRQIAIARSPLPAMATRAIVSQLYAGRIDALQSSHSHVPARHKDAPIDLAIANEGLEHGKAVHISADYAAGVEAARQRGLDAVHLHQPAVFAAEMRARDAFERYRRGDSTGVLLSLLGQVKITQGAPLPVEAQALPVLSFVMHVLEQAVLRKLDRIFFVTREGLFFKRIYDILVDADVFDLGAYPRAIVLETSRKASFAASLEAFDRDALMRLWSQYSEQSLAVLCQTINLAPDSLAKMANQAGIDLAAPRTAPWSDDELLAFLAREDVQGIVLPHLKAQRDQLLSYLRKIDFEPDRDIDRLVVDIGWRGTIQDNIARVAKGRIHGCYYGLEGFLNEQAGNVSKDGYIKDAPAGLGLKLADVAGLEFLFNTPGGSVTGYHDGTPIREVLAGEETLVNGPVASFQDRLADCAQALASAIRRHGLVSADLRGLSRELVASYFANPPADIAHAYLTLEHNESFGVAGVTTMGFASERIVALGDLPGPALHAAVLESASMVRWPAARQHIGSLLRQVNDLDQSQILSLPVLAGDSSVNPGLRKEIAILVPSAQMDDEATTLSADLARAMIADGWLVHLLVDDIQASSRSFRSEVESLSSDCILHSTWPASLNPVAAICLSWQGTRFVRDNWSATTAILSVAVPGERSARTFVDAPEVAGAHLLSLSRSAAMRIGGKDGLHAALGAMGLDPAFFQGGNAAARARRIILHTNSKGGAASLRLSIAALDLVKAQHPDVSIAIIGSPGRVSIGFDYDNLRPPKDPAARHQLYQGAAIALFDHVDGPGRTAFEAMASGCVPVDCYRSANLLDYPAGTAVLAVPKPHSLALAICKLLDSKPSTLAERAERCVAALQGRTRHWQIDYIRNALTCALEASSFNHTGPLSSLWTGAVVLDPADNSPETRAYIARQENG